MLVLTTHQIVIDTETTGLHPLDGHRVVEIGAVELLDHCPTGQTFHLVGGAGGVSTMGGRLVRGMASVRPSMPP
jgi:hypothetical protein